MQNAVFVKTRQIQIIKKLKSRKVLLPIEESSWVEPELGFVKNIKDDCRLLLKEQGIWQKSHS